MRKNVKDAPKYTEKAMDRYKTSCSDKVDINITDKTTDANRNAICSGESSNIQTRNNT